MIFVFFVPGMFGSTVEAVLRSFTNEINQHIPDILANGSMHALIKQKHLNNRESLIAFLNTDVKKESIITPIYPMSDLKLSEITSMTSNHFGEADCKILLHADSFEYAEMNMLFQYHKIVHQSVTKIGLEIFCGDNQKNIINWNPNYTNWDQMQIWELREWFSLFYTSWIREWIESPTHIDQSWVVINTEEILCNTEQTFEKIIRLSGFTRNKKDLKSFSDNWRKAQEYILKEYYLLNEIVSCTIKNIEFTWGELNVIAEAIIQQRLRAAGFEIKCDGLNQFPTNSINLHKLLN
jgi:hypothetical protein